jgi:hypothetical protein
LAFYDLPFQENVRLKKIAARPRFLRYFRHKNIKPHLGNVTLRLEGQGTPIRFLPVVAAAHVAL